jgi:hypothetical protein
VLGAIISILLLISVIALSGGAYAVGFGLWLPSAICFAFYFWIHKHEKRAIAQCKAKYLAWTSNKTNPPPLTIDYKLNCATLHYIFDSKYLKNHKDIIDVEEAELDKIIQRKDHSDPVKKVWPIKCYRCIQQITSDFYIDDNLNCFHKECVARLFET